MSSDDWWKDIDRGKGNIKKALSSDTRHATYIDWPGIVPVVKARPIFRRVRKIVKATISFVMSVRPSAWNNSDST